MIISNLFKTKKIVCGTCGTKVKDKNLAVVKVQCVDGIINMKVCSKCEERFSKRVDNGNQ